MTKVLVAVLIALILTGHVFLWRSEMAAGLKVTLTIINAAGWTIIIAPIFLVDRWLASIRTRNKETTNDL